MSVVWWWGLSHRTAPVSVLERAAVPGDDVRKTLDELHRAETISEVLLLSTCNRVEVYADVARFHPGGRRDHAPCWPGTPASRCPTCPTTSTSTSPRRPPSTCSPSPPGSTRWSSASRRSSASCASAYALGTELGTVGSVLHDLAQTALRVGKRVHAETGIDRAGASIVSVALDHADRRARDARRAAAR